MAELAATEQIDMALSLGQLLKNAREQSNLTQGDVADHLRLTSQVIERIESDDYQPEELSVFVRGYIRSYAKYVNVTNEEVESYFQSLGVAIKTQQVEPAQFVINNKQSRKKPFRLISLGIVVLLIALALVWMFWQHNDSPVNESTTMTTTNSAVNVSTLGDGANQIADQGASLAGQFGQQTSTQNRSNNL